MLGRGRAGPGEGVRAGGGDGKPRRLDQRLGDDVGRHPNRDGIQASGDVIRHLGRPPKHKRQRPRPEDLRQLIGGLRHRVGQGCQLVDMRDVRDDRIVGRASLGDIDPVDGVGIQRIGPQPIDGFRREGDQTARL